MIGTAESMALNDPETEAVVTMGSKEGLGHLALATLDQGMVSWFQILLTYSSYGFVIAGADIRHVPIGEDIDFLRAGIGCNKYFPKPKCWF